MFYAEGLVKSYKKKVDGRRIMRRVVDEVCFEVNHGEVVGLLGPNGAGKTTSFCIACGFTRPDKGKVVFDGKDITNWPMHRRARDSGLGYLPQKESVIGKLTVEDNLVATMELLGFSAKKRRARVEELIGKFRLEKVRNSLGQTLSGGERRRTEIARALISEPKIILLDEPYVGIDPVTIADFQRLILELNNEGISILITDHQVVETLRIVDRCYVLQEGKIIAEGSPDEVVANERVQKYYLGKNLANDWAREKEKIDAQKGAVGRLPKRTSPQRPARPAVQERAETPVRPERPLHPERPVRPERPLHPERPMRPERPTSLSDSAAQLGRQVRLVRRGRTLELPGANDGDATPQRQENKVSRFKRKKRKKGGKDAA